MPLARELRLDNLGFRYDEASPWVLQDIHLTLPAGSVLAVTGLSGSGKSTLADILMGLLRPQQGTVSIDGRELTADSLVPWRRSVGYVPQETFLFNDTIRANLLWSKSDATDEELWQALDAAAAKAFVQDLPNGLETVLGDRGVRLSGGERQRLALARALLRRPSLLILDEATSSLDTTHEYQIQQALQALHGELTMVVIAHRLSTIRNADRIIVLDRGRIVESGTWDQLATTPGSKLQALSVGQATAAPLPDTPEQA